MRDRMARTIAGAVLCGLALCVLSTGAWGATRAGSPPPPKVLSSVKLDANNWEIYIDNRGRNPFSLPGSQPGGYWPIGSGRNYIFGGGLWVGSINRSNPAKPDTQVTWGYNPNNGGAEFCPAAPDPANPFGDASKYLDPSAKVYLSTNPSDKMNWPEVVGGKKVIKSLQDSWTIFSDVNPIYMMSPDKSMGVEIKRVTYAWPYPGYADIVFFLFWVRNSTAKVGNPRTLTDVILGNNMDCDIGNESGTNANDKTYLDNTRYRRARGDSITRNLAVQYQTDQEGGWSIPPPYFVGFRFFESPRNNTGQTIQLRSEPGIGYPEYDRDVLPDSLLGMTAYQIFDIAFDPSLPGQRYLELSGRDYRSPGIYNAFQRDITNPADRRFIQCSGPFNLAPDSVAAFVVGCMGGYDSTAIVKNSDKAQDIYDSGFLAPFPPAAPNLTAIPGDHKITLFWDRSSETTQDPYWKEITDTSDRRRYRPFDLAGYKIYKARTISDLASPEKRFLLAHFDKADGFTVVRDAQLMFRDRPDGGKDTLIKWDTLGTDNGLRYSFVDSGQVEGDSMGMVNGVPYFYGVTGYDFQYWDSTWVDTLPSGDTAWYYYWPGNPTTLEGSATERYVIAVARTLPQDVRPARIDSSNWVLHGGAYTSSLMYLPRVVNPDTVSDSKYRDHRYRYEFLPIQKRSIPISAWGNFLPVYSMKIKDVTSNQYAKTQKWLRDTTLVTVEDTVMMTVDTTYGASGYWVYTPGKSLVFNGVEFGMLDTVKWYNSSPTRPQFKSGTVTVIRGSYRDPLIADTCVNYLTSIPRYGFKVANWAFRGSKFTITWHKRRGTVRGDSIWAEVYDSTNQVVVPPETLAVQDAAQISGWCFGGNTNTNPNQRGKLWIDSTMVSIDGINDTIPTRPQYPGTWLTLCGRRYWFFGRQGGFEGRPMFWPGGVCPINEGDVWVVQQEGFQVPCDGNWLEFQPLPNTTLAGDKKLLDAIKVVPNPYLVRNAWDADRLDKHLMFTHLPKKCTIRIFTLAGDLVKVITHDADFNSFATMGGTTPVGGVGGTEFWNLLSYNDQRVASGVYLFHVDAPGIGTKIGKFAIIQ